MFGLQKSMNKAKRQSTRCEKKNQNNISDEGFASRITYTAQQRKDK
jgi:hypothetical protein